MKLRTEIWRKTDEKRAALFFCHLAPVTNHSPQSLKGSIQVVYSCKSNAAVYVLHRWINYCCYVSWPALCSWSPPSPPLMSQSRVMRGVPLAAQAVKSLQASSLVTEGTAVGERLENTTTTASGIPAESKYFCIGYFTCSAGKSSKIRAVHCVEYRCIGKIFAYVCFFLNN